MMTLNHLMTEYFGKGYRCRSLVKTLSPRKNNLSNVTILSLLWGNSFNPLLQVSFTFFSEILWFCSFEENSMWHLSFWSCRISGLMAKRKKVPNKKSWYCRIWNVKLSSILGAEVFTFLFSCLRYFIEPQRKHGLHSEQLITTRLLIIQNSVVYVSLCFKYPKLFIFH